MEIGRIKMQIGREVRTKEKDRERERGGGGQR
jgi:hypothetical protein